MRRLCISISLNFFRMDVFDAPLTYVPCNSIRRPLVSRTPDEAKTPGSHTFSGIASHFYRIDSRCAFSRVQCQPAGRHAFPDLRKHELRLTFCFAVYNDVVGIAFKQLSRMMLLHPTIKYHMKKKVR